jgi:putative endonuclease
MVNSIQTGAIAESMAREFLQQQGLSFISQNYRCTMGELDLIFKDQKQLVIVEVKNRKNTHFGTPAEWVTASKQHKIILATQHYLANHKQLCGLSVRFDVVGILNLNRHSIEWIKNAFLAE